MQGSFKSQKNNINFTEPKPHILSKLKCSECDGYLSSTPIYLTEDGRGICGRCRTPEGAYRNTSYEALAEMISFPCNNQRHGCRTSISFRDHQTHESACEYRQYICPLLSSDSCEWLGPGFKLIDHCTSEHIDKILINPCVLKHDIKINSLKNYLMLAFQTLFLIHTKVCVKSKKIYHSIRLIGDPQQAKMFNFNLDIENRGVLMNKQGIVVEQGCMTIQEKFCTTVGVNTLQEFLGQYEGTVFRIKLNKLTSTKKCSNCQVVVHTSSDNNNKLVYCSDCIQTQISCENSKCTYKDIRMKTEKHKRYFCSFTKRCLICKTEIITSLIEHYHDENIKVVYQTGTIWQACRENNLQWCIINSLVGILVCAYRTNGSTFKFYVCSHITSDQLNSYRCMLVLSNPISSFNTAKQMDIKLDEIFDWKVQFSDQEFLNAIDNDCFYVKVILETINTNIDSETS